MSINLQTTYLGLQLQHPLIVGASPMTDNLDMVRRLEDAGAAAIVMHSLFEEQIRMEDTASEAHIGRHEDSFGEALGFFPAREEYELTPGQYLRQISRIKETCAVPVIGSLNGVTLGGWIDYARLIEQAGADALELNYYLVPAAVDEDAADVESRALEILGAIVAQVKIPVALKLSPFFSSLPHFAAEIVATGAKGIVLFNRFYQPDIDIENLEARSALHLSDSTELRLRLRWIAILSPVVRTCYSLSGGVHTAADAIKGLMAGAQTIQSVSALLKKGPNHLATILADMKTWLEEHEYDSLETLRGSMNLRHAPDPSAYERANYLRALQGWRV